MNILLGIVVGSGVFTVVIEKPASESDGEVKIKDRIKARDIVLLSF